MSDISPNGQESPTIHQHPRCSPLHVLFLWCFFCHWWCCFFDRFLRGTEQIQIAWSCLKIGPPRIQWFIIMLPIQWPETVGASKTILKNDGLRQWEGLSNIYYYMENKIHDPNHQPTVNYVTLPTISDTPCLALGKPPGIKSCFGETILWMLATHPPVFLTLSTPSSHRLQHFLLSFFQYL